MMIPSTRLTTEMLDNHYDYDYSMTQVVRPTMMRSRPRWQKWTWCWMDCFVCVCMSVCVFFVGILSIVRTIMVSGRPHIHHGSNFRCECVPPQPDIRSLTYLGLSSVSSMSQKQTSQRLPVRCYTAPVALQPALLQDWKRVTALFGRYVAGYLVKCCWLYRICCTKKVLKPRNHS